MSFSFNNHTARHLSIEDMEGHNVEADSVIDLHVPVADDHDGE